MRKDLVSRSAEGANEMNIGTDASSKTEHARHALARHGIGLRVLVKEKTLLAGGRVLALGRPV